MNDDQHQWWKGLKVEKIVLSEEAAKNFADAIANPPPPNEKLKQLLKRKPAWK